MHPIESFTNNSYTAHLVMDYDPQNPYSDDTFSQVYHWHPRYDLGTRVEHLSQIEMLQYLTESGERVMAIKPLYLYDHSGITVSTNPFSCSWDSGQVGWVVVTESNLLKMGFMDTDMDKLDKIMEDEVKHYDQYLRGEVYGYQVMLEDEVVDSCYGYYSLEDARMDATYSSMVDRTPRGIYGKSCQD